MTFEKLFSEVTTDSRYLNNLDWGKPRRGHPEGTVRAHIQELERNLEAMSVPKGSEQYWKLKLLIHVHDSFKKESRKGVPISHPESHASLAKTFLASFCQDQDLLNMVWYHDEPYALYRQDALRGRFNRERLQSLLHRISDWELFLRFLLIDGYTPGKDSAPLHWSMEHLGKARGLDGAMKQWLGELSQPFHRIA